MTLPINFHEINIALWLESDLDCVTLGKSLNLSATIYVNTLKIILATLRREGRLMMARFFR